MIVFKIMLGALLILIADVIYFSFVGPVSQSHDANLRFYLMITLAPLYVLFAYAFFKFIHEGYIREKSEKEQNETIQSSEHQI